MLKIPSIAQIRELDEQTIREQKISSFELMERACLAFVKWFSTRFDNHKSIGVVCGHGNNGGDGLGIARMLSAWGYQVKVWQVDAPASESPDTKTNREMLKGKLDIAKAGSELSAQSFAGCQVIIDAIFGSGLSRPAEGVYAHVIRCMNEAPVTRIAVDIPSGLSADSHSTGAIVEAHLTVSFQLPKLAFMFPENYRYVGNWHLADIGLSRNAIREMETPYRYITSKSVMKQIRQPGKFDHKGDHGRGVLIAGSKGKMGACILAARAATRAGLGLLTVHVPGCGYSIIQTAVPEAMATVDPDENFFTALPEGRFEVIGIGPGLGTAPATTAAFHQTLKLGKPMVIDADGLNILSRNLSWFDDVPKGSILTPHPKEFERLAGAAPDDFGRLQVQRELAARLNSVILLKGAHTAIATPGGRVYFNSTGNPGMATGGSGDVLTGILTGLLGRGYSPKMGAIVGVYLHGLAGDLAARKLGTLSLTASDLLDFLPKAFKKME